MRDTPKNSGNLNRNQPQDNTPTPETRGKNFIQLDTTKKPPAERARNATDEAIDVLSFMGFKL